MSTTGWEFGRFAQRLAALCRRNWHLTPKSAAHPHRYTNNFVAWQSINGFRLLLKPGRRVCFTALSGTQLAQLATELESGVTV